RGASNPAEEGGSVADCRFAAQAAGQHAGENHPNNRQARPEKAALRNALENGGDGEPVNGLQKADRGQNGASSPKSHSEEKTFGANGPQISAKGSRRHNAKNHDQRPDWKNYAARQNQHERRDEIELHFQGEA